MFNNPGLGGPHADVLGANPEDADSKINLVEELKRRAKGSIASKNYKEGDALYSKAIEVGPSEGLSILYANRSMCKLNMKESEAALEDAKQSITLDDKYAKAYFRKAAAHIALNQYKSAHSTLEEGLKLAPGDKSFTAQMERVVKELDRRAREGLPLDGKEKVTAVTPASDSSDGTTKKASSAPEETRKATDPPTLKQKKKEAGGKSKADKAEEEEDIGGHVRGYKMTSDGRKTTFFNNEIDEQTKALIGDIAPKPIAAPAETALQTGGGLGGTSAWNTAGTFESRDHSKWARAECEAVLAEVSFTLPQNLGIARVTKVTKVVGDAEIASARGKTKRIYDLTAELEWELRMSESSGSGNAEKKCFGRMTVSDISGDLEYECTVEVDKDSHRDSAAMVRQFIKTSGSGFQEAIYDALKTKLHGAFQERS